MPTEKGAAPAAPGLNFALGVPACLKDLVPKVRKQKGIKTRLMALQV